MGALKMEDQGLSVGRQGEVCRFATDTITSLKFCTAYDEAAHMRSEAWDSKRWQYVPVAGTSAFLSARSCESEAEVLLSEES